MSRDRFRARINCHPPPQRRTSEKFYACSRSRGQQLRVHAREGKLAATMPRTRSRYSSLTAILRLARYYSRNAASFSLSLVLVRTRICCRQIKSTTRQNDACASRGETSRWTASRIYGARMCNDPRCATRCRSRDQDQETAGHVPRKKNTTRGPRADSGSKGESSPPPPSHALCFFFSSSSSFLVIEHRGLDRKRIREEVSRVSRSCSFLFPSPNDNEPGSPYRRILRAGGKREGEKKRRKHKRTGKR